MQTRDCTACMIGRLEGAGSGCVAAEQEAEPGAWWGGAWVGAPLPVPCGSPSLSVSCQWCTCTAIRVLVGHHISPFYPVQSLKIPLTLPSCCAGSSGTHGSSHSPQCPRANSMMGRARVPISSWQGPSWMLGLPTMPTPSKLGSRFGFPAVPGGPSKACLPRVLPRQCGGPEPEQHRPPCLFPCCTWHLLSTPRALRHQSR